MDAFAILLFLIVLALAAGLALPFMGYNLLWVLGVVVALVLIIRALRSL